MKVKVLVLGMAILLSGFAGSVFAEEQTTEENVVSICPICGPEEKMMGKDDISYEYEGKTYHFCSQDCLKTFQESPEKFIQKKAEVMDKKSHEGHDHKSHEEQKNHEDHENHEGHEDHK